MKALKTCKTGCGKMSSGGPVKKVKKMAKGGATSKSQIYGIPQTGTTNYSAPTMGMGGKVTTLKKRGMGGMHMMPDGTMMKDSMMKNGGKVGSYDEILKRKAKKNLFGSAVVKEKSRTYDPMTEEMAVTKTKTVTPRNAKAGDTVRQKSKSKIILSQKVLDNLKGGGMVRKKKLAALAPPTDKITRADVIAGALKNKRKKK